MLQTSWSKPDPLFARSVADSGLQALIHTEAETPTRPANRAHRDDQDHRDAGNHGDHHRPAAAFDASPERHTQAAANGNTDAGADANADSESEPSAQAALKKPATLFGCNTTRAAWLRELRMADPARLMPRPSD